MAFDCIIRERLTSLLGLLRHYTIRAQAVTEGERYYNWFKVKSGVRQGCVFSGFIFVLIMGRAAQR